MQEILSAVPSFHFQASAWCHFRLLITLPCLVPAFANLIDYNSATLQLAFDVKPFKISCTHLSPLELNLIAILMQQVVLTKAQKVRLLDLLI